MNSSRWLAITVATLVWAIACWLGFISMGADRGTGIAILAVGLIFALYAIAGFSGAPDIGTTGFRSSLIALGIVTLLLLTYWGSGIEAFVVASPILGAGIAGAVALAPRSPGTRFWARCLAVSVVAVALVWVFGVDSGVYGFVMPLVTFGPLAVADFAFDRAREVVAETAPD